jgi:centromeric protein E
MHLSRFKVYKEHIRDLLAQSAAAPPVRMFDSTDGLVIRGLREEVVTSPEQVFAILAQGEARRQVGATHANLHSSRSHVMVRIWIESSGTSGGSSKSGGVRVSTLSLVDLAGSESVKLSGSSDRRTEGHYINKSLMTLGQVVYALSEETGKKSHVPYRDSKLTRLLQPSLSGNAQVVLVCCISPLVTHVEESHNTFKFATRAKKIPQKATVQESMDEKTLLESYREEIETLRLQLKEAKEQQERQDAKAQLSSHSTMSTASTTEEMDEDEIIELAEAIQTMEKLILKSKPKGSQRPEDLLDASEEGDITDDDEASLMALVSDLKFGATPSKPTAAPATLAVTTVDKGLHAELSRVQGLLGSVLKKRGMKGMPKTSSSPRNTATADREVRDLRAQLERQVVTTSLGKADSSFLQKQLEEKDDLLLEISKILEAVEDRQTQLEVENAALRKELSSLKAIEAYEF